MSRPGPRPLTRPRAAGLGAALGVAQTVVTLGAAGTVGGARALPVLYVLLAAGPGLLAYHFSGPGPGPGRGRSARLSRVRRAAVAGSVHGAWMFALVAALAPLPPAPGLLGRYAVCAGGLATAAYRASRSGARHAAAWATGAERPEGPGLRRTRRAPGG